MVTWPPFFRLERTFPFAQIVSLRGAMTVLFAGVVLLMLLLCLARPLRGFAASLAIIALAGAAVNGGILLARGPEILSRDALFYDGSVDDATKIAAKHAELTALGIVIRDSA